jgi:hypothetical protein
MAVKVEEVEGLIGAFIAAIEHMSAKERAERPWGHFGERYNQVLSLAKEAVPSVDARLWPPALEIPEAAMGPPHPIATYGEIDTYARQIQSIIVQHGELPLGPMRG